MRRRFMNNTQSYDYSNYMTIEAIEDVIVLFNLDVKYSTDGEKWLTSKEVKVKPNQFVSIKRIAASGESLTGIWSGAFNLRGNCMSVIYGDNAERNTSMTGFTLSGLFKNSNVVSVEKDFLSATTLAIGCYEQMFYGCKMLVNAPELPATTLESNCYSEMFYDCTGLTQSPELPATTLATGCYSSMFYNCTDLTQVPELPAITLANHCYYHMFSGCTKLIDAPELPATTLAEYCYSSMFQGCTNLVNAPELPATTLASNCYYSMFENCTKLTQAPELPATTLASSCYYSMFNGCTELTQTPELPATELANSCYYSMFENCTKLTQAPELPATTLASSCYGEMFSYCTSLTNAPELPATTLVSSCYYSMFKNCTSLTNAPELPATTLEQVCYSYMFSGCSGLTQAPELPATILATHCYSSMFRGCGSLTRAPVVLSATTLATSCYSNMFSNCTSLTKAPELPAAILEHTCYSYMFNGCTKLTYIKMLATDISASNCLNNWVNGVSSTGTFVKSKDAVWTLSGISGVPAGWTVVNDGEESDSNPDYSSYRGVYIEDVDGVLYTENEWDGSKTANGIAVLTDNCRFVMALQDAHTSTCQWGGFEKTISGIVTTTKDSTALTDYEGASNTDTIISELSGYNDSYVTGAPAAEYCKAFTFPNGKKGYLGAAGEWQAALDNKAAIVSALNKCGGLLRGSYYWTSTQYNSYSGWSMYVYDQVLKINPKNRSYYVKAFTSLKSDGEESEESKLISFTIDGTSYQAEEGMTWFEWVASGYNTGGFAVNENNLIQQGIRAIYKSASAVNKEDLIEPISYILMSMDDY